MSSKWQQYQHSICVAATLLPYCPKQASIFYVSKQLNVESSVILVWKSTSLASESKVQSMGMGDDMV